MWHSFITSSKWTRCSLLLTVAFTCLAQHISYASARSRNVSDYLVSSLPDAPAGRPLTMHSGYVEVDPEHHANIFFWHCQNQHVDQRNRTVIWLNGGPGCSSMTGAMMEIGPYRMGKAGHIELNKGTWNEVANLLFVDNPVGTGFSFVKSEGDYIHELDVMAQQFVVFLTNWFHLFPEYEKNVLYIAGESYAGQHIPYIAQAILDHRRSWNLRGLLLGNAWISPVEQNLAILDYAYESGIVRPKSSQAKELEVQQAICAERLTAGGKDHVETGECEKVLTEIFRVTRNETRLENDCLNMYDMRLRDSYPACGENWPPGLDDLTQYFHRDDVLDALHVNKAKVSVHGGWSECTSTVGNSFRARNSTPSIELLPGLLEHMPIVLYSGENDLICNRLGTERLISNMAWNGGRGFQLSQLGEDVSALAPQKQWIFEGEPAGLYQEARNLSYVVFHEASHMVPFDQPDRSRNMLQRLIESSTSCNSRKESTIDGFEDGDMGVGVGGFPASAVEDEKKKFLSGVAKELESLYPMRGDYVTAARYASIIALVIVVGLWGGYFWLKREPKAGYQKVSSSKMTLQGMEEGDLTRIINSNKPQRVRGIVSEGIPKGQAFLAMEGVIEDDGFGI